MITRRLAAHQTGEAGRLLREGKLLAFPTETVYGLGANALDREAVRAVFEAKGRPQDNPMIVHVAHPGGAETLVSAFPPVALKLAETFWPGPLTLVLPRKPIIPDIVTAGLDTVAVRCPAHAVARAVLEAAGVPVAAPSANRSGRPSPTCAAHVLEDMEGRIDAVIDGGECACGLESTVLSFREGTPLLLRPGGISPAQIMAVAGHLDISDGEASGIPASPGMKYKHYAPRTPLVILKGDAPKAAAFLAASRDRVGILCFDEEEAFFNAFAHGLLGPEKDAAEQGRRLYASLRTADTWGCDRLYIRFSGDLAVQNRVCKAAGFQVEEVR